VYTQALKGQNTKRNLKKRTIGMLHPSNFNRTAKNKDHKSNIQNRKSGSYMAQLQIDYGSGSLRQMPRLYISVTGKPANAGNFRELRHEKEHSMQ
jgi:hypothetical protein